MSTAQDETGHPDPTIDWTIFTPALLLIVVSGVGMIAWPERGGEMAGHSQSKIRHIEFQFLLRLT